MNIFHDHFDGDVTQVHAGVAVRRLPLAWDSAWLSNLFDESDEGSNPDWVADSGRYLMEMVHNCSSNRQIGMILVAKCSYCICLQLV